MTYNPMSYHNGSVWPHDNSLIAAGFYRYGYEDDAHRVLRALAGRCLDRSSARLPELFCGFTRGVDMDDAPVRYPVSCSPQAWAAGAIPLLLRGMLGLQVDPARRVLTVDPHLPDWLPSVYDERTFRARRARLVDGHSIQRRLSGRIGRIAAGIGFDRSCHANSSNFLKKRGTPCLLQR